MSRGVKDMVQFKLVIGDPKTGKTMQKEVKDETAQAFLGLKIGDTVKGSPADQIMPAFPCVQMHRVFYEEKFLLFPALE